MNEKCGVCGNEEIEEFEAKEIEAFKCKICDHRWGRYVFRD